ncbi:hypothetical protein BZM26_03320 [Paraburkholderia strydomiana]|nr:hypothetical protein BZM26_03320 [Paraburkholderia strydomiana]
MAGYFQIRASVTSLLAIEKCQLLVNDFVWRLAADVHRKSFDDSCQRRNARTKCAREYYVLILAIFFK